MFDDHDDGYYGNSVWNPNQPFIVIENTDENTFKTTSEKVREAGPLSKRWDTKVLEFIMPAQQGMYIKNKLSNKPHWEAEHGKKKYWTTLAETRHNAPTVVREATSGPHVQTPNETIATNVNDQLYHEVVKEHKDKMDFKGILKELIPEMIKNGVCERGNVAKTSGFTDMHQREEKESEVTKPQITKDTSIEDVKRMCHATDMVYDLVDRLKNEQPDARCDLLSILDKDMTRVDEFACDLCRKKGLPPKREDGKPANIFELFTKGITVCNQSAKEQYLPLLNGKKVEPFLLKCHTDWKNCPRFSFVIVLYEYLFDEETGLMYRVVTIFTWKKTVLDYYARLTKGRFFKNEILIPYYEYGLSQGRLRPTLDDCHRPEFKDEPYKPSKCIARYDKVTSYMSAYGTVIWDCLKKHGWAYNLFKACELVLIAMLATTPVNYYKAVRQITGQDTPRGRNGVENNLSILIMDMALQDAGGINNGTGQRHTFHWTHSPIVEDICEWLCILFDGVINIRATDGEMSVPAASKLFSRIPYVGDLGAQHGLYLFTMKGWLRPKYCVESSLAKGTKTAATFKEVVGLPPATVNKIYSDVAEKWGEPTEVSEQVGCECIRDNQMDVPFNAVACEERLGYRRTNQKNFQERPDCIFYGQSLFHVKRDENDEWGVSFDRRVFDSSGGYEDVATRVHYITDEEAGHPVSGAGRSFWLRGVLSIILREEVKVSTNTTLRGAIKLDDGKPAKGRKRKRTTQYPDPEIHDDDDLQEGETYRSSIPRSQQLRVHATSRRMRSNIISCQNLVGANKEDGTYRLIDFPDLARIMVSPHVRGKKREKSITKKRCSLKKFYSMETITTSGGHRVFTASIGAGGGTIGTSMNDIVSLQHRKCIVPSESRSCYIDETSAMKAVILRSICEIPYRRGRVANGVPTWVDNALPMSRKGVPSKDFCALYGHIRTSRFGGTPRHDLFGVLVFDGNERMLLIPKGGGEVGDEWQTIRFKELYDAHNRK